ncbi:hypothetical protein E1286_01645 [Nonomuraea terrae]|uniref:Uncharacterized protein n=1 Tax=Nonomuraea terrae TaxID=2530383 RepID=A0A4V2YPA6_9ACTN|nr:hypothetical protein [Nonomuraea terrae]TDD57017.1 hypothetical protein E1286_01645 [Nonomuraea terrae]
MKAEATPLEADMTTIVAVAVAVILVAAIGFVMVEQRRQRIGSRRRAVPNEGDNRRGADQVRRARQGQIIILDIKPLTTESQRAYSERWTAIQTQFANAPGPAVRAADRLLTSVLVERGYLAEGFEQQPDSPLAHDRMLHRYRQAYEISARVARGGASAEDLRQAMVHYHVLFQELLDDTDEHLFPRSPDRAHHDQPASQGDSRNGSRKGDAT